MQFFNAMQSTIIDHFGGTKCLVSLANFCISIILVLKAVMCFTTTYLVKFRKIHKRTSAWSSSFSKVPGSWVQFYQKKAPWQPFYELKRHDMNFRISKTFHKIIYLFSKKIIQPDFRTSVNVKRRFFKKINYHLTLKTLNIMKGFRSGMV